MEIDELSYVFLNVLYFKSRNRLNTGFSYKLIFQLMEIEDNIGNDVISYISQNKLIDTSNGYGNNIILTAKGLEEVIRYRKNKSFIVLRFTDTKYKPSSIAAIEYIYHYEIQYDEENTKNHTIRILISRELSIGWGYQIWSMQPDKDYQSLRKILLKIAKDKITEKLKENTLSEVEELTLLPKDYPFRCPFDSKKLIDLNNAEFEIENEVETSFQKNNISENSLAASIIETRDLINNVFYHKHNEALLLLNHERQLLDFFKSAKTEEDLTCRIASISDVARNFNVSKLRQLTKNQKDLSVDLLDTYLKNINCANNDAIIFFRQIGRIRQAYPIHNDKTGLIDCCKYFGLKYPINDYQMAWTTILQKYLICLKSLYKSIEKYCLEDKE